MIMLFNSCEKLKKIEFKDDSELQMISSCILSGTLISDFTIPANVSNIVNYSIENKRLKKVTIHPNNKHFFENKDKVIFWKKEAASDSFDALI